jgi:putative glutamine amidotransferase
MLPPVVGVTSYTPAGSSTNGYWLPREYLDSLRSAALQPVLLTGGDGSACLRRVEGLVLSGGGDIDPSLYGGVSHPTAYFVDPERDAFETELLSVALDRGMPVLAICRGLQLLNVLRGGTLVPHVPDRYGETVAHRSPPREPTAHQVRLVPGCRLARILGRDTVTTVSWHHQAVDRLGDGLRIVARSSDSVVEALELERHPSVLAIQWHPELAAPGAPRQDDLFGAFASDVRAYAAGQEER